MRSGAVPDQVKEMLNEEIDPTDEIGDLFGGSPTKKVIHVLVVVDREGLEARDTEIAPHPSRKRRWDKLNEVLDKNKKAKKSAGSTGFSYVSFSEINNIMPAVEYEQTSKPIPDEKLDAVHGYFPLLLKAFGDVVTGKEAKRLHFIVPVLASVCALFNGDRRDKRVCIVEAKRDDIQQGLAHAYVGSEALADVEGLTQVYSIVTNFVEWYFSRSLDEKIERTSAITISMENHVPTRESVKRIAEMIYSILSEDN
ncbi:hypothetical protein PC113_g18372 [Phytophthora cactorum]|uniref:Uncharacterized protein n=1 Tax=Phytophthora cactorum TaxID=29920 RepID=A0A8T1CZ05_9STRA|nr:hypothetical protein PC113_g18372 [Phytophthora cactorum]KAG2930442.1 hypothetical protein PC115_g6470 [Phytophthora cactorum]KAG3199227.1 hypothetical protein PC128_g5445 [Phytophthora cactorum]